MSWITDATIVGYVTDHDATFLTTPAPQDERGQHFERLANAGDAAGGSKVYGTHLYAAGFNYFDRWEILDWLATHRFSDVTDVALIFNAEGDAHATVVYRIREGRIEEPSWTAYQGGDE